MGDRTAVLVIRLTVESGRLRATVTSARDIMVRAPDRTFSTSDLGEVMEEIGAVAADLLGRAG
jgi:hypothetical protein